MEVYDWIAVAAGAAAVIALVLCAVLWASLRRVRATQQVLLPDGASAGLVRQFDLGCAGSIRSSRNRTSPVGGGAR